MPKTARTYRLSQDALEAIENRDRQKYPTASDLIESKILEAGREKEEKDFRESFVELNQKMEMVLQILQNLSGKGTAGNEPPLPDGFAGKNDWRI